MQLYDDLVHEREPPAGRKDKAEGGLERHLTEAAVLLAFAMHLFETEPDLLEIEIHPDGEHGKRFDIRGWLEKQGFQLTKSVGTTSYGGVYSHGERTIIVSLKPGLGDVVALTDRQTIIAECKGGVINSRHAGQLSRLRRGLCEAVGLLMVRDPSKERNIAVVPYTNETSRLARRMIERCHISGIEIALIQADGEVNYVGKLR
ncbi:MAG: hypothetical protein OSB58_08270 [Alphaproteobacteria bacterium]|nr:hypothetical protein [Alphaproteobacteria bacterium]